MNCTMSVLRMYGSDAVSTKGKHLIGTWHLPEWAPDFRCHDLKLEGCILKHEKRSSGCENNDRLLQKFRCFYVEKPLLNRLGTDTA